MLKFSLITPSRSRISRIKRLIKSIKKNSKNLSRIELVMFLDLDDPMINQYRKISDKKIKIKKIFTQNKMVSMGKMIDTICFNATGDYLVYINDDAYIKTKNWDLKLNKIIKKNNWYSIFYMNDGFQGSKCLSWPVYSRKIHLISKKMCPHYYVGHFLDVHIKDIFKRLEYLTKKKLCFYVKNVVFYHTHPLLGNSESDIVYKRRMAGNKYGGNLFLANYLDREEAAKTIFSFLKKTKINVPVKSKYKKQFNLIDFFKSTLFSKTPWHWRLYMTLFFILIFLSNIKRKIVN